MEIYCWGQNRLRGNQRRKLLWKFPLWKREIKFKRKEKGNTGIEFRNNSKKYSHDKVFEKGYSKPRTTDPRQRNTHRPTPQRGVLDRMHRPTRPFGELNRASRQTRRKGQLDRTCSPTRPFGELDQSACLRPVLVAPPFGIRSNLLMFHLDRSHRWNFTI